MSAANLVPIAYAWGMSPKDPSELDHHAVWHLFFSQTLTRHLPFLSIFYTAEEKEMPNSFCNSKGQIGYVLTYVESKLF